MKSIRLGIIGCGGFVRSHCNAIKDGIGALRISALCDTDPEKAEGLAKQFLPRRKVPIFQDYKKMIRNAELDAVIVSSPHTLHYPHAYAALGAGLHVMVDKPCVTNAAHARKLLQRARAKKRCLNIAVQGTHTDTFAYSRKLINDGTLGELQLITGTLAQGWLEAVRGTWRQKPELSGGGQLYDSMAHVFSAMMFLVNSPVKEVFCWADNKDVPVDINAVGSIKFANGCMGSFTCGGNCDTWLSRLTLQGKKAMLQISPHGGDFLVSGRGLKRDIKAPPRNWDIPTVSPAQNFADCIRGKAQPRCGVRFGVLLSDLMDALYESIASGLPAKVTRKPPKE